MLIKYVHVSTPDTEKTHDTEKAYRGCIGFMRSMGSYPTQADFDRDELKRFERDKEKGVILSYQPLV